MRRKGDNSVNQKRLIEAALRCIAQNGISKTFIEDIALEAGLSRPTAYRAFGTRKALLEGVAAHSANLIKATMKAKLARYESFEDAMTLGPAASLALARKDRTFVAVIGALGDDGLERYLLDPAGPVIGYTTEAWSDWFERARAGGKLRPGIENIELATLICASNCFFMLRRDFRKHDQVAYLRKFLLPAILARPPAD